MHLRSMYWNYSFFSVIILSFSKQRHCIDIYSECHKKALTSLKRRIMSQPLLPLQAADKHLPKVDPGNIHRLFSPGAFMSPFPRLLWHISHFLAPRTSDCGFWPQCELYYSSPDMSYMFILKPMHKILIWTSGKGKTIYGKDSSGTR